MRYKADACAAHSPRYRECAPRSFFNTAFFIPVAYGRLRAGGAQNVRRSARLLSEHFVAHDECPKSATSLQVSRHMFRVRGRPRPSKRCGRRIDTDPRVS